MAETWTGTGDEAALRLLATRVPAILWSTDRHLRVSSCTGSGLKAFEMRGSSVMGQTIPECFGIEESGGISAAAHERALGGAATTYEVLWRDRWYRCHVAPLLDAKGARTGVVGVALEITESKRLEAQLMQSQKMEGIGRLAGGIAHDFNNLLTSILGYAELAAGALGGGAAPHQEIEAIKEAGLRAADLTRQLLAFSRKQVLQPRILDLNAVVSGFEQILRRTLGETVDLRVDLDPGLGRVRADRSQVEQVLLNLAVNGRDAMVSGGLLTIRTGNARMGEGRMPRHPGMAKGPYVSLAVIDTGVGMDAKTQSRLFEPFFTTKELGRGTGLGLSTVYGIVRQSGGFISVDSSPGKGSRFEVFFPQVEGRTETVSAELPAVRMSRGSETVLVVEDEEGVLALAERILKTVGYTVLTARSGEEALERCREHRGAIQLLLTDVVMPRMAGPEVARKLRDLHPESRVLYMSGYPGDKIAHHGVLERDVMLLEKPFTPEVLAAKVRKAIDRVS